jgi:hypothetical protein
VCEIDAKIVKFGAKPQPENRINATSDWPPMGIATAAGTGLKTRTVLTTSTVTPVGITLPVPRILATGTPRPINTGPREKDNW